MGYADKDKQREYGRLWRQKRRDDYMADKSCLFCGSTDSLELDHIDPERKVDHRIWSWSEERRLAEIDKCRVLCKPCHEKRTAQWYVDNRKHNRTGYKYGCRCDICKQAQKKHNAQRYTSH